MAHEQNREKTRKKRGDAPPKELISESELPDFGEWFSYQDPAGTEYARVHYSKHERAVPYAYHGDGQWERRPPKQRWPYRISTISTSIPILVVHDEACARRGAKILDRRMAVLGWMGDAHMWGSTDWTALRERHVILWPANTTPEKDAVLGLAMHLTTLGAHVYFLRIPEDKPLGWDLTRAIQEAGEQSVEQIRDFVQAQMIRYEVNPFQPVDESEEDRRHLEREFKTEEDPSAISKTAAGLRQALNQLNFQTRYNLRSNHHELRRMTAAGQVWLPWYARLGFNAGDTGWVRMGEFLEAHLLDQLHTNFKIAGSMRPYYLRGDEFKRAFLSIQMDRNVDDFKDWLLRGLPAWDGTARIGDLAEDILGAYPLEAHDKWLALIQHVSHCLFIGPIQRTLEPGCELDETIIMLGPGGRGKTKFYNYLFPPEKENWYVGPIDFSDTRKELIEMVEGAVVVEAGEMILTALTHAQRLKMKNFMTHQKDKIRAVYARKAETSPRRFVVIGTANSDTMGTLYYDGDSHRRFIVIDVVGCHKGWDYATNYLRANMLQLWAEGLHWYRQGYRAKLPEELQWWRKEAVRAHMEHDELFIEKLRDLEDQVRKGSNQLLHPYDPNVGYKMSEIGRATGLYKDEASAKGDRAFMRRLGQALKQDHWIPRRVPLDGGQREWHWFLPIRDNIEAE